MKKFLLYFAIGAVLGAAVVSGSYFLFREKAPEQQANPPAGVSRPSRKMSLKKKSHPQKKVSAPRASTSAVAPRRITRIAPAQSVGEARPQEAQKAKAAQEELDCQKVAAWDHLVDDVVREDNTQSIEERARRVQKAFAELPEKDKDVGMQSLLNLLPDGSFGIVAPMMMDPKGDPEVADAIFSDLLNRPEELKNGYILEIAKNKEHPSFVDAMHICEVTGLREAEEKKAKAQKREAAVNE